MSGLCCCGKIHKENVKIITGFYKFSLGIHSEFVVLVIKSVKEKYDEHYENTQRLSASKIFNSSQSSNLNILQCCKDHAFNIPHTFLSTDIMLK